MEPSAKSGNPRSTRRSTTVPVAGTALLLIDVINDLAFDGSGPLVEQAEPMASRLAVLKRGATDAGVPAIYVNDNFGSGGQTFAGRWRTARRARQPAAWSRDAFARRRATYFVLKPKHSGFYDTTLDTLLETLRIRCVILTGIAGNICVLFTANDAYMRDLKILAPADCMVSNRAAENAHALQQIRTTLKGNLTPSTDLTFRRSKARASRSTRATSRHGDPGRGGGGGRGVRIMSGKER